MGGELTKIKQGESERLGVEAWGGKKDRMELSGVCK